MKIGKTYLRYSESFKQEVVRHIQETGAGPEPYHHLSSEVKLSRIFRTLSFPTLPKRKNLCKTKNIVIGYEP